MDLILYCSVLVFIAYKRMEETKAVSEEVGIVQVGVTVPENELPLSSNLELKKELGAYTLILEELGLLNVK